VAQQIGRQRISQGVKTDHPLPIRHVENGIRIEEPFEG